MIQDNRAVFISASNIKVSINTQSYSVKVTHKPTGLVSEYNKYKSIHKNRVEALLLLREMLSNLPFQSQRQSSKLVTHNIA